MKPIKKNDAGTEEIIEFYLSESKHPIAYKAKMDELMNSCGMTKGQAQSMIADTPFQMEMYYSTDEGLFMVESEAVEAVIPMYNPYDGVQMIEIED